MLEDYLALTLPSQAVLQAYVHFEGLLDEDYSFVCNLCGIHSRILIYDTFRKATFSFAGTAQQFSFCCTLSMSMSKRNKPF